MDNHHVSWENGYIFIYIQWLYLISRGELEYIHIQYSIIPTDGLLSSSIMIWTEHTWTVSINHQDEEVTSDSMGRLGNSAHAIDQSQWRLANLRFAMVFADYVMGQKVKTSYHHFFRGEESSSNHVPFGISRFRLGTRVLTHNAVGNINRFNPRLSYWLEASATNAESVHRWPGISVCSSGTR